MRELKRSIARENMRKMGFVHINKKAHENRCKPHGQIILCGTLAGICFP